MNKLKMPKMPKMNINETNVFYFLFLVSILSIIYIFYNEIYRHEKLHEGMENKKTIILMGDRILKNNQYVSKGKSVEDILTQRYNGTVINLAKDNSTIKDMYDQIDSLTHDNDNNYNSDKYTTIFVSIGGNDILNKYVYVNDMDVYNLNHLYDIYFNYKYMFKRLRLKYPNAKIIIMNLYYPKSVKYFKYEDLIKRWNELLFDFKKDPMNNVTDILDLPLIMTDSSDFSLSIEPSERGSEKIVNEILKFSEE